MLRRFSTGFAIFSMGLDAAFVIIGITLANMLRPALNRLPMVKPLTKGFEFHPTLYLVFVILWVSVLLFVSIYDGRRNLRIVNELATLFSGTALAGILLSGVLFLFFRETSRALFITFWVITALLMLLWRLVYRIIIQKQNGRAAAKRRVLILGAGQLGQLVAQHFQKTQDILGVQLIGFLDDDPLKIEQNENIFGRLDQARLIVNQKKVQDVILALPPRAYERIIDLVIQLHDLPVKVYLIPDYFDLALHKAVMTEFAGVPVADLRAPALSEYQRMVKRAFDIFFTLIILPFILPVMGVLAVMVWLEDRGPIFFHQDRVGENGQIFQMIKFRTMIIDAEKLRHLVETQDDNGNPIYKTANDPRITPIGRFLRRTSLDELPQFINVLKGEMSLVGPRPELPYLVEKYEHWQRTRFAVPQGITGWWQVNGRSDKPMHLNTEDDIYYVQHYSMWLDFWILLKTFFVVLRGKGAY